MPAAGDYQGVPMTADARKIADTWDPAKEQFIGDAEANQWLDRAKRGPWKV